MRNRLSLLLLVVLPAPLPLHAQASDSIRATPRISVWLSGGGGFYLAAKMREQRYDLNDYSGFLGQRSIWVAGRGLVIGGRLSRGTGIRGSLTPRDERSLLIGARSRSRLGHLVIAARIARAKFNDYYQDDSFSPPTRHARDERGLALAGEFARTGRYVGVGLTGVGVITEGARYAALTMSVQLGLFR